VKRRGQERGLSIEKVKITHIAVPDAGQRIARALDLLVQVPKNHIPPLDGEIIDKSQNKHGKD